MSNIPANFTDGVVTISDDNSNSATLLMPNGDQSLTGLVPDGRAIEDYQSQGAVVGLRKGERAYPEFTVTAISAAGIEAFKRLALGITATFTSTSVAIGDYPTFDLDYSYDYGAETRDITAQDVALVGMDETAGSPNSVSYTFRIYGPLLIDGETVISSR